jgi:hypothetical protein
MIQVIQYKFIIRVEMVCFESVISREEGKEEEKKILHCHYYEAFVTLP